MQNVSMDNKNPSNLRNFFEKLCKLSYRHENKGKPPITVEDVKLYSRVHSLENELTITKEERDQALTENRSKIDELNSALVSMKSIIHEMLEAKKNRIQHLERKIGREVKI